MATSSFDAFRAELEALKGLLAASNKKTLRNEESRERFRLLYRSWVSAVKPFLEPYLKSKREFFKLGAELEAIAKLTAKFKSIEEYHKRLKRIISLADSIVLYLPPIEASQMPSRSFGGYELFTPGIPDLPVQFVPNPMVGWKSNIEAFISKYPFDNSVFIMIRYRERNKYLIRAIKDVITEHGYSGILASEHNLTKDLYNPVACLLCCARGIAVFDEAEDSEQFNPNVAYELGMMSLLGRDCLLLKHASLKSLHTDILMRLYVEYDTPTTAKSHVKKWISREE